MPLLTDQAVVLAILDRDRDWAAYAIGDLAPALAQHCEWRAPADESALLLVYRGFDPPITFAMGKPPGIREVFREIDAPRISLHVQQDALDAIADVYRPEHTRLMRRMTLRPAMFKPSPHDEVQPIRESDIAAVSALYDDGHRRGDGPTFFHESMLQQGTFRGIWDEGALVAIAGTHLFSAELRVCAIGNVYTRSDRRGRGFGAKVTSAVVALALDQNVTTIVLNVAHHNAVARRVYERLGFDSYCDFLEGEATRIR